MPSYSSDIKKLVVEQLISGNKTLEQLQEEYKVSRTTLFRWQAQYRSKLNHICDSLNPSALSDFAKQTSIALGSSNKLKPYGHSKVIDNHEIIKLYLPKEQYEHKLTYGKSTNPCSDEDDAAFIDKSKINDSCMHKSALNIDGKDNCDEKDQLALSIDENLKPHNSLEGYFREFKLSELLQAAIKAQISHWHGPKCDELERYYGINMEQLRNFYDLVTNEGLVSGSIYAQMQHKLLELEQKAHHQELKIKALEAKEQLYCFYLEAFKKQSSLYKLDFNSLNDELKHDFLALIKQLIDSGMTAKQASLMIGINMRTYYRWLKQDEQRANAHDMAKYQSTKEHDHINLDANNDNANSSSLSTMASYQDSNSKIILQANENSQCFNDDVSFDNLAKPKASDLLKATAKKSEYKFISTDEHEFIKELLLLPQYQGLKVKDCYDKLKEQQLTTMSLSTFYRFIKSDPKLKAILSKSS